jgi:hypothetical protein
VEKTQVVTRRTAGDLLIVISVASLILLGATSYSIGQTLMWTYETESRNYWNPTYRPILCNLNTSVPVQNLTIDFNYLRIAHFNITGAPISILIIDSDGQVIMNVSEVTGELVSGAAHDRGNCYNISMDSKGGESTIEFIHIDYTWAQEDYVVSTFEMTPKSVEVMTLGGVFFSIAAAILLARIYLHLIRDRHIVRDVPPWMTFQERKSKARERIVDMDIE